MADESDNDVNSFHSASLPQYRKSHILSEEIPIQVSEKPPPRSAKLDPNRGERLDTFRDDCNNVITT
jgi:hypothetical protein